jgi:hypothetical protein
MAPVILSFTFLVLLYGFLWAGLALGALLTKVVVERWPSTPIENSAPPPLSG